MSASLLGQKVGDFVSINIVAISGRPSQHLTHTSFNPTILVPERST
ncbi:hypothetical protein F383_27387 [Gossypium arboreum]|uniref:Uncharacterized protein n=1 Tax=Gossypium arboreum TaxID=29729 RepID=A0A0B0MRK3_GOSAR|nr:hypothetical protein F383_27387 [Gossypium arboreum]